MLAAVAVLAAAACFGSEADTLEVDAVTVDGARARANPASNDSWLDSPTTRPSAGVRQEKSTVTEMSMYIDVVTEDTVSTQQLTQDASSRDPAVGLRAVASLRILVDRLQDLQVQSARDEGWSWQRIATALGVSRQAVHQRYAARGLLRRDK